MAEAVLEARFRQLKQFWYDGVFESKEEYLMCRAAVVDGYREDMKKDGWLEGERVDGVGCYMGELSEECRKELCDVVMKGCGDKGLWKDRIEALADRVLMQRSEAGCLTDPKLVAAEIYRIIDKEIPHETKAALSLTISNSVADRKQRKRRRTPDSSPEPPSADLKSEIALLKQQNTELQQQLYMYSQWAANATEAAAAASQPEDTQPPPPPPKKPKN
eukprot:TRINITY_DN5368_c0_g1_i1.p1 TRINITY_DN5368_c0_g1~~TRINITY_DN5368_c0_g1_i1.p1  ORF type:complete len:218 (+),score=57.09 TRINITY_DN5368_c0_g1_i1:293-946(+)